MCFGSRDDAEAKRSREIDALIHRDEKVVQRQVKLLLLGEPFCLCLSSTSGMGDKPSGQQLTFAI